LVDLVRFEDFVANGAGGFAEDRSLLEIKVNGLNFGKVKAIYPEDLVFINEIFVLLGFM
jgi:hypothetical protein